MALTPLPNETELLKKIASGCADSYTLLFNTYFTQVSGFVQSLTQCCELTEEIVQDVFTKLWLNRERLAEVRKIDAYIFIMTRNHTLTSIRNANTKRKHLEEFSYQLEDIELPKIFHEQEPDYSLLIDRAVTSLPQRQQQVFSLRRKGFKNPEIAVKLDISGPSVIKYQQLALKSISRFIRMNTLSLIFSLLYLFKNS